MGCLEMHDATLHETSHSSPSSSSAAHGMSSMYVAASKDEANLLTLLDCLFRSLLPRTVLQISGYHAPEVMVRHGTWP